MILNKSSRHAKFYIDWYEEELPNNLYLYFWKLLYAIVIQSIIYTLFLPRVIISNFEKNYKFDIIIFSLKFYLFIISIWFVLSYILFIFFGIFFKPVNEEDAFFCISVSVGMFILCTLIIYSLIKLLTKLKVISKNVKKLFIFINKIVLKFCPQINWKDEETNNN